MQIVGCYKDTKEDAKNKRYKISMSTRKRSPKFVANNQLIDPIDIKLVFLKELNKNSALVNEFLLDDTISREYQL